ncbi:MAG: hypothetical protein NZ898_15840 [Myxococcota bacterium]|nr:hypothetical protein [Myxococcota bacterium]MDW8363984.1 hypothetical protein [Myxococcales bacterium]
MSDPADSLVAAFARRVRAVADAGAAPGSFDPVATAASALLARLEEEARCGPTGRLDGPEHAELLSMAAGLGRQIARERDAVATALVAARAIDVGARERGVALESGAVETLRTAIVEGYAAALEEGASQLAAEAAAQAVAIVRTAPRVVSTFLWGPQRAEQVAGIVDRLGRTLLSEQAVALVVDVRGLVDPDPPLAAEIFSADSTARMLGARTWFSGVEEPLRAAARAARVPLEELAIRSAYESALRDALEAAGWRLVPRRWRWLRMR